MKLRLPWAVAVLIATAAAATLRAQGAASPAPALPAEFNTQTGQRIRVTMVAGGLFHPWSIVFPDARTILVAERNGKIRMIRDGVLQAQPVWEAPPHPASDNGLQFLALHPQFAQNHLVYLSYPKRGDKGTTLGISRGRFDGTTLADVKEIFVADAWETSGNLAGHMMFAPDSTLYVMVGDRDRLCCTGSEDNSLRMKAQALDNHVGKTLRIKDDGGVPADNPFAGRAGVKPEIFTYGHRNGYGLSINPQTGELWQAEIGPMGGDEVNVLLPGHNYGWPLVSMGRNYTGSLASDQPWFRPGMDNPRMFWVPSISPSSLLWYTGDKFPNWKNSLFVGALTTRVLLRMSFGQPSQAERRDQLLKELNIRIRDIQQSPDGFIYLATEQQIRGDAPDGAVLRLEPVN